MPVVGVEYFLEGRGMFLCFRSHAFRHGLSNLNLLHYFLPNIKTTQDGQSMKQVTDLVFHLKDTGFGSKRGGNIEGAPQNSFGMIKNICF